MLSDLSEINENTRTLNNKKITIIRDCTLVFYGISMFFLYSIFLNKAINVFILK